MTEARKTPFYDQHLSLEGKVVDYSGWLLPVQYPGGLVDEVRRTREEATVFDVSHMGEIAVRGPDAESYLQKILVNDISELKDGAIAYSPICYPHGGVVDDILVYRLTGDDYLLVVNAANTDKDYQWLQEHASNGAMVTDLSSRYAQVAVQGPAAPALVGEISAVPLGGVRYYHFLPSVNLGGVDCLVSRTGYTGEDGFEIYCLPEDAPALWKALWEAGQGTLSPAGLGARDVLRLEASLPLYGHELGPELSPLQAGLDRFVALDKEVPFIGQEALRRQREEGLGRRLCGLIMEGRAPARQGYPVLGDGREIGLISSGSFSPTLERFIAMAFLDEKEVEIGRSVDVLIRGRSYPAQVVKMPFYRRKK